MVGQAILSAMYGDPSSQISQALNPGGPNPAPNPNPGAPPAPGAASGPSAGGPGPGGAGGPSAPPAPPMAPAQATQSPPDLAQLYLKLHAQDRAANEIDRGTALMASAFGTAQQQHDMMNYAQNIPMDNRDDVLSKSIVAQGELTKQQDAARFKAGAAGMATLLGVSPDQATWLASNPDAMNDVIKTHFANMSETEAQKNVDAATAAQAAANPGMSQQEIQQYKANLLSGIATGGDMTTKEMGAASRAWDADPANKGQPKPTWMTNPAEYKGHVAQLVEDQKDIGNAKNSYGANMAKLSPVQENINWLNAHPAETTAAVQHPNLTSGNLGYYTGSFTEGAGALEARRRLDWLNSQLYSTSFTGGGAANQRLAATEAARLGSAFDPFHSENAANMTQNDVQNALGNLKDNLDSAVANTKAGAGLQLTPEEGKAKFLNQNFFDPNSTLHSGATIAKGESKPAAGGGKTYTYNPKTGQLE